MFPASRVLFSFVFAELTEQGKRDLYLGLKMAILSMRHGNFAAKPLCDVLTFVGSINNSRINVKKCTAHNELKLQSANNARSMYFGMSCPRLWTVVELKLFSTQCRGLFSLVPSAGVFCRTQNAEGSMMVMERR